jgi:O-antigen biosynthesis protein WbqP
MDERFHIVSASHNAEFPEVSIAAARGKQVASPRMIRVVDIILAVISGVVFAIPMLLIAIAIKMTSKGPVLHWSKRVGRYNRNFLMPKFRTMKLDSPQIATHLMANPEIYLTRIGQLLRKGSVDELPQIWSVLIGDLSFVGPRPALYNQHDLVELRTRYGIHELVPGVTGWAQVNGRDELSVPDKVAFDREYAERKSPIFDLKILLLTIVKVFQGAGVRH